MKLGFEKILNAKESNYLMKYSKMIAYKKLYRKYSRYVKRISFRPFYIIVFFIQFFIVYYNISKNNVDDAIKKHVFIYLVILTIIIIIFATSIILYYFKNKRIVMKKLKEWDNKLEGISGDEN